MRQRLVQLALAFMALTVVAAAPAFAALPFGSLEPINGGGNAGAGIIAVTGWALDDDGIQRVDLYVDGFIAALAHYGGNRPDVALVFPGFPDDPHSGFGVLLDSTHYLNGQHTLSARVTSNTGEQVFLNDVSIEILNTTANLVPFGAIIIPASSQELFGVCNLDDPFRRLTVVYGYALDLGLADGDTGVGYVELLIDGSFFANTRVDCFFDNSLGGFTNCYGVPSLAVEAVYPTVANSPHAGFRFVVDIGALIAEFGYVEGFHELTIRAGDQIGQVSEIAKIPVTFTCDDRVGDQGSFGDFASPPDGGYINGITTLSGWALDWEGVDHVEVWVNGNFVANATYGLPYPGVTFFYPGFPDSLLPGWSYDLDTTPYADGFNDVQIRVVDIFGFKTITAERRFFVRNELP